MRWPNRAGSAAAASAVAVSVLAAGCRGAPVDEPRREVVRARNVLVITIDTLRADHLPPYGYEKVATPAISRLAQEGVRFASAFTPAPLTLPAHASVFTGLQPFRHGVRDNGAFSLDPQHATLASTLKRHGFQTAAFVSAFVLDSRWGLANGFDHYFDGFTVSAADLAAIARVQRTGGDTWRQARAWLEAHRSGRFFVWLHLFDPHTPYAAPEPYRAQYADRPYDGEIAYSDSVVGEAIAFLESQQALDETLVVLLSDHGEGLGDHGEEEHGLLAYDSTLRVPWIIRLPGAARRGAVVARLVSLVDVAPTVIGLLGIALPAGLDGVDLTPLVTGAGTLPRDELYAETYYPRLRFNWSELVSVRNQQYKFIRAPRPELYDFRADANESRNLADSEPAVVASLSQILNRMAAPPGDAPIARGADPDAARRLGSLGYVAGGAAAGGRASGPLADPKDKVDVYRSLAHARKLLEQGSDRAGTSALEAIVSKEPDLEPARRLLREYWLQRGEVRRGVSWFRAAVARDPQSAPLLVELGTFELAANAPERAMAAFDQALTRAPASVEALLGAARAAAAVGQGERALELLRKAGSESSDATPRLKLAEMLIKMDRPGEAESVLTSALAADTRLAGAHYLLAQIAEERRDLARAEREYRLEMELAPWDYRAAFNLAAIAGGRKDHREQVALLEAIPRIAPEFGEVFFYLAKALLDLGDRSRFAEAAAAARKGLALAPASPSAPLGHYVLADLYTLEGKRAEAQQQLRLGQRLENRRR
jgi:arylsulfatase A-like enzyme/tetratricopeptide (TPR) repeat protein